MDNTDLPTGTPGTQSRSSRKKSGNRDARVLEWDDQKTAIIEFTTPKGEVVRGKFVLAIWTRAPSDVMKQVLKAISSPPRHMAGKPMGPSSS